MCVVCSLLAVCWYVAVQVQVKYSFVALEKRGQRLLPNTKKTRQTLVVCSLCFPLFSACVLLMVALVCWLVLVLELVLVLAGCFVEIAPAGIEVAVAAAAAAAAAAASTAAVVVVPSRRSGSRVVVVV